jgi:hypothetical protein
VIKLDFVEEDVITCHECEDRLVFGEQYRDVKEGVICSLFCYNEYLAIDKTIDELKEIHKREAI